MVNRFCCRENIVQTRLDTNTLSMGMGVMKGFGTGKKDTEDIDLEVPEIASVFFVL